MGWLVVAILEAAWLVGLSGWILLERRSSTATIAWILGLALLPGIGAVVYFFFGPRRLRRKRIRHALARSAVASFREGSEVSFTENPLTDPRHSRLSRVGESLGEAPPIRTRGLDFFFDGDSCFDRLLADVASARSHVHAEYFLMTDGEIGTRLRDALAERARAGVEVRLLVDSVGSFGLGDRFFDPIREAGGHVLRFQPLRIARLRPRPINFRNHRKIVVVDGRIAFTGGMNVADYHLPSIAGDAAWRDTHLRVEGAAALPLELIFLEDWCDAAEESPLDERYLPVEGPPSDGPAVQFLASGPDLDVFPVYEALIALLAEARERAWLTTPYFVPDESILTALGAAALRGVDVRVLVPRRSDQRMTDAASRSYHADLVREGARLFVYEPGMIHAKTMVVDRDLALVGTANLDNRSFRLNFEVVALIYDGDATARLARSFEENLQRATEVTDPADRSVIPRLWEGFARLFSPVL